MELRGALEELRAASRPLLLVVGGGAGLRTARPGRVALLSGSFDPPTAGHLALAEAVVGRSDLVVLVYSVRTLPKEGVGPPPLLSEEERVGAIRRVARAHPGLAAGVCSHGLLADQAAAAADRFPGAELCLVMGSDKVVQLLDPRWYRDRDATLSALFARAGVIYAERAGHGGGLEALLERPENRRWRDRFERVELPPEVAAISSREVRERLRRGEDVSALVPPEVLSLRPRDGWGEVPPRSRPRGVGSR